MSAASAHYRHSMSAIQRASNRSAAGASAYRGARKIVDPRTKAEYDYTRRSGVVATHIIVPGGAPNTVTAQELWSAVELSHRRKDAVPAREIVVALPHQIGALRREQLTLTYASELSQRYGVAVDVAIHSPTRREGAGSLNDHAHLLMSACSVEILGGELVCGKKVEALDPISASRKGGEPICEAERRRWCELVNAELSASGATVLADHRSHERRGTGLLPQPKLGPAGLSNLHRWIDSDGATPLLTATSRWLDVADINDAIRDAQVESTEWIAVADHLRCVGEPSAIAPPTAVVEVKASLIAPEVNPPLREIDGAVGTAPMLAVAGPPDESGPDETAECEARLAELAARTQQRVDAVERYRAAKQTASDVEGGILAKMRTALGWSPPAIVVAAQSAAETARVAAVALMQTQRRAVGLPPLKAGVGRLDPARMAMELHAIDGRERLELQTRLRDLGRKPAQSEPNAYEPKQVSKLPTLRNIGLAGSDGAAAVSASRGLGESSAGRTESNPSASEPPQMPEIGIAVETARALTASGERGAGPWAWVRAVVMALLRRLDAVVRGADRQDWTGLRVMDEQPRQPDRTPIEVVEVVLEQDTAATTEIAVEFSERLPELIELEREEDEKEESDREEGENDEDEDGTAPDQDWPVPGM